MYNHKVIAIVLFFLCVEVALAAKKRPQPSPTANNTGHASYSSQVDKLEKEAYTFTLTDIELRARHKTYKTLKEKNDKFAATARSNIEKLSILITETDKALESKPEKAKRLQLKKRKRRLKEKRKDENKSLNKKNQFDFDDYSFVFNHFKCYYFICFFHELVLLSGYHDLFNFPNLGVKL